MIEPTVTALGYECLGVERAGAGRDSVVRVYIDCAAGVTLEDCERVSHQVSGLLDVEDPIEGSYRLEVSSPGLDRPLFRERDYQRFAGSEARMRLRDPIEGRRRLRGVLRGAEQGTVTIAVEGRDLRVALEAIEEARLIPGL